MKTNPIRIQKWLTLLLMLISVQAFSQSSKKYQSLFWEISGNGIKTPSYLYGSMHVSNKIAFHLSDTFFVALKSVDMVALEENPEKFMEIYGYYAELRSGTENYYNDYFNYNKSSTDGFYYDAFKLSYPIRTDIIDYLAGGNNYINQLLYRYDSYDNGNDGGDYTDNFSESTYLDLFVYQAGKKYGKQIINLEDFFTTMDLQVKSSKPDEDKKEYDYSDWDYSSTYNISQKIEDAYLQGDLDLMDSLDRVIYKSKNFRKYFIDERNKLMANKMDSLLKVGISLFTTIGAAHLPGDLGVIELLRSKGYTVKPIHKYLVSKSTSAKKELDNKKVKVTFAPWLPNDSTFEVSVPGKMYLMPFSSQDRFYLYPDMANGSYYVVSRIPTAQFLNNHSIEFILAQIDSSLYQGIPGEIITKTSIEKSGYQGYDILNKTKRGDYQRSQIIVTPLEILIFKMGGLRKYVKEEGDAFFNSIKFPKGNSWKTIASLAKGYSIKAKEGYTLSESVITGYKSTRTDQILQFVDSVKNFSMMMRASFHDYNYIEDDKFELRMLASNFVKDKGFKVVDSVISLNQTYPELLMKYKNESNDYLHLKILINGPYYYLLASVTPSSKVPDNFFNSLILQKSKCTDWTMHTDTSLHFSVELPKISAPKGIDADDLYQSYSSYYGSNYKNKDYESYSSEKTYRFSPTDDAVTVSYDRYHKYQKFKNLDEFWKSASIKVAGLDFNFYNKFSSLFSQYMKKSDNFLDLKPKYKISQPKKYSEGINQIYEFTLTDSLSTRGIKTKMILKNGVLYTLQTCIDTAQGMTEFSNKFFETFKPADTLIGTDLFADKSDLFFKNINSPDTNFVREALESINTVDFTEKDISRLTNLFNTFDFKKWGLSYKLDLIDVYGIPDSDSSLAMLKNIYLNSGDTASLKFQVLKSLAKIQTIKSFEVINNLLQQDIPFDNGSYSISGMFGYFNDSLELAAKLFPTLLNHSRYEEYRDKIYELLSELVDSNKINPEIYKSHLKEIIADGNKELKGTITDENDESYNKSDSYYSYYNYKDEMNDELYSYASVLMPFYNDPQAKLFIDKTLNTNNKELKLYLSILMLKNKITVDDSIWESFAKNDEYCARLYTKLKEINRIDKFPSAYANQDFITRSLLAESSYNHNEDTVVFLTKKIVINIEKKSESGYLYFYKYADKEKLKWKLAYCGIQPLDSNLVNADDPVYIKLDKETLPNEQDKIDELINETARMLQLVNHERCGYYNSSYY